MLRATAPPLRRAAASSWSASKAAAMRRSRRLPNAVGAAATAAAASLMLRTSSVVEGFGGGGGAGFGTSMGRMVGGAGVRASSSSSLSLPTAMATSGGPRAFRWQCGGGARRPAAIARADGALLPRPAAVRLFSSESKGGGDGDDDDRMVEMSAEELGEYLTPAVSDYDYDRDEEENAADQSTDPRRHRKEMLEAATDLDRLLVATPTPELLEYYHAAASELLDLGELAASEHCWRRSLDIFPENPAIRERLAATLRMRGKLREAALELHATIRDVEDGPDRALLYLDLGALLERIAPLPGAGPDWDVGTGEAPTVCVGGKKGRLPAGMGGDGRAAMGFLADVPQRRRGEGKKDAPKKDKKKKKKKKQQLEYPGEDLTAEICYRRAVRSDPTNGEAHKRLADCLAVLGGGGRNEKIMEEALEEFREAARLMPQDVCCATHALYGAPDGGGRALEALPLTEERGTSDREVDLGDLIWNLSSNGDASAEGAAAAFERNGALVLPNLLSAAHIEALERAVEAKSAAAERAEGEEGGDGGGEEDDATNVDNADADFGSQRSRSPSEVDYTVETREPAHREHRSLPLVGETREAVSAVLSALYPILSRILQAPPPGHDGDGDNNTNKDSGRMPLLGAGYMRIDPGARRQELHKDVHHYDRHGPVEGMPGGEGRGGGGGPRTVSIQIQLTETSTFAGGGGSGGRRGVGGSLEVLPGSHRPDGARGRPDQITRALKDSEGVVPIAVPPGTVTIYSSRLWHRGGENAADIGEEEGAVGGAKSPKSRTFCFLTVTEPGAPAPPGLIHTMEPEDVGRWVVASEGGLEEVVPAVAAAAEDR